MVKNLKIIFSTVVAFFVFSSSKAAKLSENQTIEIKKACETFYKLSNFGQLCSFKNGIFDFDITCKGGRPATKNERSNFCKCLSINLSHAVEKGSFWILKRMLQRKSIQGEVTMELSEVFYQAFSGCGKSRSWRSEAARNPANATRSELLNKKNEF